MEPLRLDRAARDAMLAHARAEHPEECCGAILAREGRADEVVRFTNVQNRLHAENPAEHPRDARTAYAPDPREVVAVLRAADEPGARLAVLYHSHAVNGSYFSDEDRARAMYGGGDDPAYPEASYVVVSDARVEGEVRAFRWDPAACDFVEQPIVLRDGPEAERGGAA